MLAQNFGGIEEHERRRVDTLQGSDESRSRELVCQQMRQFSSLYTHIRGGKKDYLINQDYKIANYELIYNSIKLIILFLFNYFKSDRTYSATALQRRTRLLKTTNTQHI